MIVDLSLTFSTTALQNYLQTVLSVAVDFRRSKAVSAGSGYRRLSNNSVYAKSAEITLIYLPVEGPSILMPYALRLLCKF